MNNIIKRPIFYKRYKPGICYTGIFLFDKILDEQTIDLLNGLHNTDRVKRSTKKLASFLNISIEDTINLYGEEGELYYNLHNDDKQTITDYNNPPGTQPSTTLLWNYNKEENGIECKQEYENWPINNYEIEWLQYIIDMILQPNNYFLNGKVHCEYCDYNCSIDDNTGLNENVYITINNNIIHNKTIFTSFKY